MCVRSRAPSRFHILPAAFDTETIDHLTTPRHTHTRRCVEIYLAYTGPDGHGEIAEALNDLGYVLWDACANPVFIGQGAQIPVLLFSSWLLLLLHCCLRRCCCCC